LFEKIQKLPSYQIKDEIIMSDTYIVARKIQVVPVGDKTEINRVYKYLRDGIDSQNRAMNQYMDSLYHAHINEATKEDRKEFNNFYGRISTSKKGSAYGEDISFATGIPIGGFTQKVRADFDNANKKGAAHGVVRYPEYTKSNPLIIHIDYVRLRRTNPHVDAGIYHNYISDEEFKKHLYEKDLEILWKFCNGITFKLVFGNLKKSMELRNVFENIFDEVYEIRGSTIQINNKGQIILNLSISMPVRNVPLDENIVVGVDLGIAIPAVCALNNSTKIRKSLGSADDFLRVKNQMKQQRRRLQASVRYGAGGHGRKKKIKAVDKLRSHEANWVKNYNHTVSRKVVDFALANHAKYINLEDLSGITETAASKNARFLKDWSYFQLQQDIKYKAEKVGIVVRMIDPAYTSRTCSCCGHTDKSQRVSQSEFYCSNPECKMHGKYINADFNAARNIAMSDKFISDTKKKGGKKKDKLTTE